eukprot:c11182_g1_i3.p1 GENE.c11182_g1_i3~~c11182_g1_i3.p1  ORF type:complete len:668 (+),score=177.72 c11182_g1_i3:38-2041(+)
MFAVRLFVRGGQRHQPLLLSTQHVLCARPLSLLSSFRPTEQTAIHSSIQARLISTTTSVYAASSRPATIKKTTTTTKKSKPKVKTAAIIDQSDAAEVSRDDEWWKTNKSNLPEGHRWKTLHHNGILFPAPYEPHGVEMKYDGKSIKLSASGEEAATWYATVLDTDHASKHVFNQNFFADFRKLLGPNHVIKTLEKCDFTPIREYIRQKQEIKKNETKEEKAKAKKVREAIKEKYGYAVVDGVREKIANHAIEPPGLFRGRGDHPKTGSIKNRIQPEDVTLNLSKDAPIPECPVKGHSWGTIVHRPDVTWLAFWKNPISGEAKYVFLSPSSRLRGEKDLQKFEIARKLATQISGIRKEIMSLASSSDSESSQLGTALHLIDRLALRAGNEKDIDEEADTVGCSTLRVEHVTVTGPNEIRLEFLGKDSVPYCNTITVHEKIVSNIRKFSKGKQKDEKLFDDLNTVKLNRKLQSMMAGLTAKVFRTFNASHTFEKELAQNKKEIAASENDLEKVKLYNRANKSVALLCNHQRAVVKNFPERVEELRKKIATEQAELNEVKQQHKSVAKSSKKGENVREQKQLARKIETLSNRLQRLEAQLENLESNKSVSLSTSKINYCDPRITVAWCKTHNLPIAKVFNKSLLEKFPWAFQNNDVGDSWRFAPDNKIDK